MQTQGASVHTDDGAGLVGIGLFASDPEMLADCVADSSLRELAIVGNDYCMLVVAYRDLIIVGSFASGKPGV